MKNAVLILALAISLQGLKAEESQVPFKVGDIVRLTPPAFGSKNEKPCDLIIEVKDIKGKWVSDCAHNWINSDLYLYISVNLPEDIRLVKHLPDPNSVNPTPAISGNTNTAWVPKVTRKGRPLTPAEQNPKKDAPPSELESK